MSEEDFIKVWSESSRESILHQFYWERKELREIIDKAIKYIDEAITSDSFTKLPSGKTTDIVECIPAFKDLLEILKGEDKE